MEKPRHLEGIPSSDENISIQKTTRAVILEVGMETSLNAFSLCDGPNIMTEWGSIMTETLRTALSLSLH